MAKGDQLNLRMDVAFVAKLEADAKRYGMGKNSAAVEIIETYYEYWRKMHEDILDVRSKHLDTIAKQPLPKRRAG